MHPNNNKADLETLKQGKPYIRSILAVVFKLRFGLWDVTQCYTQADVFIKKLEEDVKYNQ